MNVAIIPARGGSKRIPRKNVRLFAGLPMIAHTIRAAQNAGVFDRIIVSTDDDEIAAIARQYGAEVPFRRPVELANDFAGTDVVLQHALGWLREHGGAPEFFCCLYATAPLMRAADIRDGLDLLKKSGAASAFPVTTFPYTIFRALKVNERGRMAMIWPENFPKRSQDFPEAIHDAGQFYWADTAKYLAAGRLLTDDTLPIPIPRQRVQDIDTPEDWAVAEQIFQTLEKSASETSSAWNPGRLFIRADASATMGTGHVMRMLALAQAWRRIAGTPVTFLCAEIPDGIARRVRDEGFEVVPLGDVRDQAADARATLDEVTQRVAGTGSWIAADGYRFDIGFQRAIKAAGCRLLVMDDNGENGEYGCDIVANQNIDASEAMHAKRDEAVKLLLGPEYALLRPEFADGCAGRTAKPPSEWNILVTMGGSDPENATAVVLDALESCTCKSVTVVVGSANPNLEALRARAAKSKGRVNLVVDTKEMRALMERADLAISAGGSTVWEMCRMGLPMVLLSIAENQDAVIRAIADAGIAVNAGGVGSDAAARIRCAVESLFREPERMAAMSERGVALVDGLGAGRVVEAMREISTRAPVRCLFLGYLWEVAEAIRKADPRSLVAVGIEPQRHRSAEAIRYCEANDVPWFDARGVRDNDRVKKILAGGVDVIVVGGFGQILDDVILGAPRHGVLNIHTSYLPAYRGGSPIEEQILRGEKTGGVSLLWMTGEVDAGPILAQQRVALAGRYYEDILRDCVHGAAELMAKQMAVPVTEWPRVAQSSATQPQFPSRREADAILDWNERADVLLLRVRAFGWKGWAAAYNGGERVVVRRAMKLRSIGAIGGVGTVLEGGEMPVILTASGALKLIEWSGPALNAGDVLKG